MLRYEGTQLGVGKSTALAPQTIVTHHLDIINVNNFKLVSRTYWDKIIKNCEFKYY